MMASYSRLPGGNIAPCRFVVLEPGQPGRVLQSGANGEVYGISQKETRRYELPGYADGFAGVLGDGAINIIGPGDDEALLDLGGTVAAGDYIRSDANGRGVVATANNDRVGAQALVGGVNGDRIRVKPIRFDRGI